MVYMIFVVFTFMINNAEITLENTAEETDDVYKSSANVNLGPNLIKGFINITHAEPHNRQLNQERKKRAVFKPKVCYGLRSCYGRCSKKRQFHNVKKNRSSAACYCDAECETVFYDCCADYKYHCRVKRKKVMSSGITRTWQCDNEINNFPFGVWVIGKCHPRWPMNEVAKRCSYLSKKSRKASDVIPVFDVKKNTYRNRYCAQCNYVKSFALWKYRIKCKKRVPKRYTEIQKMKHLDSYCDAESILFIRESRGIRYCYQVVDTCQFARRSKQCKKGTPGLVTLNEKTYKNLDCVLCNHKKQNKSLMMFCGPFNSSEDRLKDPKGFLSFSSVFKAPGSDSDEPTSPTEVPGKCSSYQIYDDDTDTCWNTTIVDNHGSFLKKLFIRLQYHQSEDTCFEGNTTYVEYALNQMTKFFYGGFKTKLDHQLKTLGWQLSDFGAYIGNDYCFVTFQVLGVANNKLDLPLQDLKLDKLSLHFKFNGELKKCGYDMMGSIVRKMSCMDGKTYYMGDEKLLTLSNESVFINEIKTYYHYGEYVLYESENKTSVGVCKGFRPANCSYYLDIKNSTSWFLSPNRSLFSHVTSSWYHYGDYSIINSTLWLCLTKAMLKEAINFQNSTNQTFQKQTKKSSVQNLILSYTTLTVLTISIISLLILIFVYTIFPPLRNLPGKNLMLLCGTLALAQLLWLLQSKIYLWSTGLCVVTSIALQYFFLASFCCSGSIAFHSFLTFHALANGKLHRRPCSGKSFWGFVMYGLGFPIILVASFWLLDFYNVLNIGYGTGQGHCWFGTSFGLYVAFIYPLFALLFVNFIFLFATIRVIYKCTKASQKVAENNGGPNKKRVWIYVRMSTIMGTTWLLGVLILLFPGVIVFDYLFVVLNGLQGLYLAAAFLFTDNVKKVISKNTKGIKSNTSTGKTSFM